MSNLLKIILERVEYEQLIEEGRDPVELLHYKYQDVPSDIIDKIIAIDPTKKKSYSQWLLSHWEDEADIILHNLLNGRIEKLFQHYKNHNDIQIKDCPSVSEGLRSFVPEEDTVLSKSSQPMTYLENLGKEVDSDLANDFDIVFNEDDWIIAVPNTYEAECKLGENMAWCTANHFGNGERYYNDYLGRGGKYYVNFNMTQGETAKGKDYPFTRYQFHFESRQFMDKDDEPVQLDEIDIPESAIEFYESEGYDTTDFENEEARWERYNQDRAEASYYLNDDIYLCIEYDDNYHYEAPTEDTDFYVFDINDERDPISWKEIPNPFTNQDVIIKQDEINKEYFILRKKYGKENEVLLVIKDNATRYREWSGYAISNYIILPDSIGIFALSDEKYTYFTDKGPFDFDRMKVNNCEKIFINEACTKADAKKWGRIFVETVGDGYHSLFALSYDASMGHDMECIVKRDDPVNDEYFMIDENGAVQGTFRTYNAYDDGNENENYLNYDLSDEIWNGDYIISIDEKNENTGQYHELLNILKKGTKEPLLPVWFDKFIGFGLGLYLVSKGDKCAYFDENGQQIGDWYNSYSIIDKEGIAAGSIGKGGLSERCDIINAKERRVIAQFRHLNRTNSASKNILVLTNDGEKKIYNYAKREFAYPEFETIQGIINYHYSLFCKLRGREDGVIFDFDTQKITASNVLKISMLDKIDDIVRLEKTNNKFNAYSVESAKELLQTDVDEIQYLARNIIYRIGETYHVYNWSQKKVVLNPNGFNIPPSEIDTYNDRVCFQVDKYFVVFRLTSYQCKFDYWGIQTNPVGPPDKYSYDLDENTPPEVINLYNTISGEGQEVQQQPQQQEPALSTVGEDFKRFMKRIDEADKLRKRQIFD